jgi:hypothetical protein
LKPFKPATKALVHAFSSERGDKPPLRAQP